MNPDITYTPLPFEYIEEMAMLSNEDFGELCRALLLYARDGKEIQPEGSGRYYAVRVMRKADFYLQKAGEELAGKASRTRHAKTAAAARYTEKDCSGMLEHARADNINNNNNNNINNNAMDNNKNTSSLNYEIVLSNNFSPEAQICAPVCRLITAEKTEFSVSEEDVALWSEAFPALDVRQKLGEMKAWLDANPKNRKTEKGMKRFIVNWLSREQNSARPDKAAAKAKPVKEFIPTEF